MLDHLRHWDRRLATHYGRIAGSRIGGFLGRALLGIFWTLAGIQNTMHVWTALNAQGVDFSLSTTTLHTVLQAAFIWLLAIFVIMRRPARQFMRTVSSGLIAVAGTWALVLLAFGASVEMNPLLVPLSNILLLLGITTSVWSITMLGRCFSVLPEVRGLVVRGPYRWVRHPLYLGEILGAAGMILPIAGVFQLVVFGLFVLLQFTRTHYEEANLLDVFPEYKGYQQRTWRLLPGIL